MLDLATPNTANLKGSVATAAAVQDCAEGNTQE